MLEITLRICVRRELIRENRMSEWMDRFLSTRQLKAQRAGRDANMLDFAISVTPDMTKKLIRQLTEDLKQYSEVTGDPITVQSSPTGGSIVDGDRTVSAVLLALKRDQTGQPVIHCKGQANTKNSEPPEFDIHVIARSQDDFFYKCDDESLDVAGMSEAILAPLLSRRSIR